MENGNWTNEMSGLRQSHLDDVAHNDPWGFNPQHSDPDTFEIGCECSHCTSLAEERRYFDWYLGEGEFEGCSDGGPEVCSGCAACDREIAQAAH